MNQVQEIINEVKKAVSGKDQVLLWMLTAFLAGGHVLLEDLPGVGKTTAALAFSRALGLEYGRVQFNPDVLPSDITGYSVLHKESGEMRYQPGAILCHLFLADELNRATSRTQSALLEAMEEGQVTVDGISHPLPRPFFVIATQNPAGAAGTQQLPDSQIDRFTIRLSLGYPDKDAEFAMVQNRLNGNPLERIRPIVDRSGFLAMQQKVSEVYVHDDIIKYIVSLTAATRKTALLVRGASPRATLAVLSVSRAAAYIAGRDYVVPNDVLSVYRQILPHRLKLSQEAASKGISLADVLDTLAGQSAPPRI